MNAQQQQTCGFFIDCSLEPHESIIDVTETRAQHGNSPCRHYAGFPRFDQLCKNPSCFRLMSHRLREMCEAERWPGHATRHVGRAALSLKAGGVGIYPASDFVHIDTGRVRTW